MKRKLKYILAAICFNIFIFSVLSIEESNAYRNSPDYSNASETPFEPKDYNFKDQTSGLYKKSHFGTHDWIADSALRILYEFDKKNSWKWLIHDLNDKNPVWTEQYGYGKKHNVIRSYISFLFATQMPDMKIENSYKMEPSKHPRIINLMKYEGEVIGDSSQNGLNNWVGQIHKQNYRWIPVHMNILGGKKYIFITQKDVNHHYKSAEIAHLLAKNAIRCLTHKEQNIDTGDLESWAKPEAAACYLGAMVHYIGDIACPPHLLKPNDYYYNEVIDSQHKINVEHYDSGWHSSFERKVSLFTKWDSFKGIPNGYYETGEFFVVDLLTKISKSVRNIPAIPPNIAVILMARKGVEISYGHIDGKGYEEPNGKKGLYINSIVRSKLPNGAFWDWNTLDRHSYQPIIENGLTYKQYYDKVELLLNWAIYYSASAMKWTMNQVHNKTRGDLNYDKWAETAYEEIANPVPNPITNWDELQNKLSESHKDSWFYINFGKTIVIMMPIIAASLAEEIMLSIISKKLIGIPSMA